MGFFRRGQSVWLFLLVVFLGAIAGSIVAEALRGVVPVLAASRAAGFQLDDLNLAGLLRVNFGLSVNISVGAAIGGLIGALIGKRL